MIRQTDRLPVVAEGQGPFCRRIADASGQPVATCYQCQRCTSWCPAAEYMDLRPHQMVRLIQLGLSEKLYGSRSLWLCMGCAGCGAACPNDIDFHRVADALQQSADADAQAKGSDLRAFDRAMLASIAKHGRASELGMVVRFKLATWKLFADMKLGMWMFLRRKLKIFPRRLRGRGEVREMFDRSRKRKEGGS